VLVRSRVPASFLAVLVLALAVAGVGCPCVNSAVNGSDGLRWWLFSNFGASKICPEMLKRGVPIKLASIGPNTMGRFFPQQCQVNVNDGDRSMSVAVAGIGYAFLPLTRRVGFSAQVRVEYRPDFHLEDDATYVWGRFSRFLDGPTLKIIGVENSLASAAAATPLGDVATNIGQGMAGSEIARGFTVVRTDDGDDFAMGILSPPARPPRPFSPGKDHVLLAADTIELHASEREYLGPFFIDGSDQALFTKLRVAAAPVSTFLIDKGTGDLWMQPYLGAQPLAAPPGPTITSGVANVGDSAQVGIVAPGAYYLVVENRAVPVQIPFGVPIPMPEVVSTVTYSVETGDKP
jgi:hypothetical protein